jgi:hypothetical protein
VKAHQRLQRARVQLGRLVRGIEQLTMQIAVDDAGCEPRYRADMRAQHFQSCLLGKPLRYGDDRHQDDSGGQADGPERARGEASDGGHARIFAQSRKRPHSKTFVSARPVLLLPVAQSIDNRRS